MAQSDVQTLTRVRHYLDDSSNYPIRIADLPVLFGMNESSLTRGFKRLFGRKPYQYYLYSSMHWAKSQLDSGLPIKEIAYRLEYADVSNFRRAFKRVHGFYPLNPTGLLE